MSVLPRVDLPQPDSPTRPNTSPLRTVEADVVDRLDVADVAAQEAADDRVVLDEVLDLDERRARRCSDASPATAGAALDGAAGTASAGAGGASACAAPRRSKVIARARRGRVAVAPGVGSASRAPACTASRRRPAGRPRRSAGRGSAHGSKAYGQRGAKLQPGGMLNGFGTVPLMTFSRSPRLPFDGIDVEQALGVRVLRGEQHLVHPALLDDPAGVHHHDVLDRLGDDARGRG